MEQALGHPWKMIQCTDTCLSIRNLRGDDGPGSLDAALNLVADLEPTRIEWSYIRDHEVIDQLTAHGATFVSALNTISPNGHARTFEGEPVVAPWMRGFGEPGKRRHYMCMNNPNDVRTRLDQAQEMIIGGITDSFQFDDWYCNAQMLHFGKPCFCAFCRRAFSEYLGLGMDFDYRDYLLGRGITHTEQLLALARDGKVPLWQDYERSAQETVTRFFRKLRATIDRCNGKPASLSVNNSVSGFGGRVDTVAPFLDYMNGETHDFSAAALEKLADASQENGLLQVVSFFPDVPPNRFHDDAFVDRVNRASALCYVLGLIPLFPYDVWGGPDKPRWYGTWEEYRRTWKIVREHPECFRGYTWTAADFGNDAEWRLETRHRETGKSLVHRLGKKGEWTID